MFDFSGACARLVGAVGLAVLAVTAGCAATGDLPARASPAYQVPCPAGWKLVCVVDRPTLADRRAAAGGPCRCVPFL